jgi:hypothetical protein
MGNWWARDGDNGVGKGWGVTHLFDLRVGIQHSMGNCAFVIYLSLQ